MKAHMLAAPLQLKTELRELPELRENEVLIKVKAVGICGSDIHLYKGTYNGPCTYPMLFGHEWSGIVEKIGGKVTGFEVGDKVTGDCSQYCGECENCKKDKNLCKSIEKFGITIDGASAEYIVRDQKYLYKASEQANFTLLALTEPVAVANHLIRKIVAQTGALNHKNILIYGGGAIGQAALLLLKYHYNCKNVDLFDLVEYRTALAQKLGANIPDASKLVWNLPSDYETMYNKTLYDVVIETTGVASVFANGLKLLKPLGVLGCVGMIANVEIPQKMIVTKALTIVGSIGGTEDFEEVIAFIEENKERVSHLISHRFPIEQADEAFALATNAEKAMKIVLELN